MSKKIVAGFTRALSTRAASALAVGIFHHTGELASNECLKVHAALKDWATFREANKTFTEREAFLALCYEMDHKGRAAYVRRIYKRFIRQRRLREEAEVTAQVNILWAAKNDNFRL